MVSEGQDVSLLIAVDEGDHLVVLVEKILPAVFRAAEEVFIV